MTKECSKKKQSAQRLGVNRLAYSCAKVMAFIQAAELFSKLWSAEIIHFFKKKKHPADGNYVDKKKIQELKKTCCRNKVEDCFCRATHPPMKGQESLFAQVFVLIYRKCLPRKFCKNNFQLYFCNMFFNSCFFFLQT